MGPALIYWFPILIAIPVGVAINLATPYFARILSGQSARFRRARELKRSREADRRMWLASNPSILLVDLFRQVIAFVLMCTGVLLAQLISTIIAFTKEGSFSTYAAMAFFFVATAFFASAMASIVTRMRRLWDVVVLVSRRTDLKVGEVLSKGVNDEAAPLVTEAGDDSSSA